jgi:hypothetical protein
VRFAAPSGGTDDLVRLIVRPSASVLSDPATKGPVYERRIAEKHWQERWPKLRIYRLSDLF